MVINLQIKIDAAQELSFYASYIKRGQPDLVRISSLAEARNRLCQMGCLIGANLMAQLKGKPGRHNAAAPGSWSNRWDHYRAYSGPSELYSLATDVSSLEAQWIGYHMYHADWPAGSDYLLSGTKNMIASASAIADIVYAFDRVTSAVVGCSREVSLKKRTLEAIEAAKRLGYCVVDEDKILDFLEVLVNARNLHVFREIKT